MADSWPFGCHQSESHVVAAGPPVTTVAELHLVSTLPGLSPRTLLLLDLDTDRAEDTEDPGAAAPLPVPLTLGQARELHAVLDKLLAAAASTQS